MDARPVAFITGIAGQDGSYLAELLLRKGYAVHGLLRRNSDPFPIRLNHLYGKLQLWPGDLCDLSGLTQLLYRIQPREIYHLAAQSIVSQSWNQPLLTGDITALGTLRILEAMRQAVPSARFYQSSSSEQFGSVNSSPQNETTPFQPRNMYGVSKVFAHQTTVNYREHYGLFACCGIMFNHESPRRGKEFVTRRISQGVADIASGKSDVLTLGSMDARRDWGFAGDYVDAMWRMLQQDSAEDYVIGTGVTHTVEQLVETAFNHVGLYYLDWVKVDPDLVRPAEVNELRADASKARDKLGWESSLSFSDLIGMMVEEDLRVIQRTSPTILSLPTRRLAKIA